VHIEANILGSAGPFIPNPAFASDGFPASRGFFVWSPRVFFTADEVNVTELEVQIMLGVSDDTSANPNQQTQLPGPIVHLTNKTLPGGFGVDSSTTPSSSSGPNVAAIVVPIILVLLIAAGAFVCYRSYRKTGRLPVLGRFMGSAAVRRRRSGLHDLPPPSGQGFGSSDLHGAGAGEVQLSDRESPRRAGGAEGGSGGDVRNVFREEMQRQEQAGKL
jgi:hypothetical protein